MKTIATVALAALLAHLTLGGRDDPPGNVFALAQIPPGAVRDPLPGWNEGPAKHAIVDFVRRVTEFEGRDFVPVSERVATFDNDGTLWSEQPMYAQLAFAIDRVKAMAVANPDWRQRQPFKAVLDGNPAAVTAQGDAAMAELIAATHTGNTTDEFDHIVRDWIGAARHPQSHRLYTQMVYEPMRQLLVFLRANGFKTYIVSGGGVEFLRPWTEDVYGVPPEQVIGSRVKMRYEPRQGMPVLFRLNDVDLFDDKAGKPVGIQQAIGRRPIAAFGNSDGDFEMLEWTTSGPGPHLGLLVHHTDSAREWAYDRESAVGRLSRGLDEAPGRHWVVVDMNADWNVIFPPVN